MNTKGKDMNSKIAAWERNKRKWYNFYFFSGVGINFILYYTKPYGFDPSHSIFWGSLYGIAVPLATMLVGAYIHEKMIGLK